MLACRLVVYLQVRRRIENQDKQKEREERRKLIESGQFDLDQLSLSTTDDEENETIEDIDDEELERLIKISRRIHKQQKRRTLEKDDRTIGHTEDSVDLSQNVDFSAAGVNYNSVGSKLLDDSLDNEPLLVGGDETKKCI